VAVHSLVANWFSVGHVLRTAAGTSSL